MKKSASFLISLCVILFFLPTCTGKFAKEKVPDEIHIELMFASGDLMGTDIRFYEVSKKGKEISNCFMTGSPTGKTFLKSLDPIEWKSISPEDAANSFMFSEGAVSSDKFSKLWKTIISLTFLKNRTFDWRIQETEQGSGVLVIKYLNARSKWKTVACNFPLFPVYDVKYFSRPKITKIIYEFLYREEISKTENLRDMLEVIAKSNKMEETSNKSKEQIIIYLNKIYNDKHYDEFKYLTKLSLKRFGVSPVMNFKN